MIGLDGRRVYLDWNAAAPLRPEARSAMLRAMEETGNPSSVHAEGRAAKKIVEQARSQVAGLVGCDPGEVVFTSGATEAVALACGNARRVHCGDWEHDCVVAWRDRTGGDSSPQGDYGGEDIAACQYANGETGVMCIMSLCDPAGAGKWSCGKGGKLRDIAQCVGRASVGPALEAEFAVVASEKIGGPAGAGALVVRNGREPEAILIGGGQERGRRSGAENVVGIAGFGAAAEAARRDFDAGVWERVETLRDGLESRLSKAAPETIFFGRESPRLPNTSCFAVPGWKGETQVMQMDLAGFAVSAGSACSSGKVNKASRVLTAMGFAEPVVSSAIRVSMGPTTTEAEVAAFADVWIERLGRRELRAA